MEPTTSLPYRLKISLSSVVAFLIRMAKRWAAPGGGPRITSV
jgi:hypothetical protein